MPVYFEMCRKICGFYTSPELLYGIKWEGWRGGGGGKTATLQTTDSEHCKIQNYCNSESQTLPACQQMEHGTKQNKRTSQSNFPTDVFFSILWCILLFLGCKIFLFEFTTDHVFRIYHVFCALTYILSRSARLYGLTMVMTTTEDSTPLLDLETKCSQLKCSFLAPKCDFQAKRNTLLGSGVSVHICD